MGDEGETGRVDSGERFQVMPKKKKKKKKTEDTGSRRVVG